MTSILDVPAIFSLYNGGVIDATFLSMLEFDRDGNVNLLRHGSTLIGPGGSMDIGPAARRIVFCGTFRAVGLEACGEDGRLVIHQEGGVPRGVDRVQAISFNGRRMAQEGKEVLYVTERAVFRLTADGPLLIEIAPGVDLDEDVLAQMDFRPAVSPDLTPMDPALFRRGPGGLRKRWEQEGEARAAPAATR